MRRYQAPIVRFLTRMTGDRGLAEEIAQDAFVKAYTNLATFDTTRRLSSWLFRIAHNAALDVLRKARPPVTSLDAPGWSGYEPAASPSPDPVEREALGRALEAAVGALRPEYRAAITLRYDEDLSFEDIGLILAVPPATARSHVHRARRELAERLAAAGWEPGRP